MEHKRPRKSWTTLGWVYDEGVDHVQRHMVTGVHQRAPCAAEFRPSAKSTILAFVVAHSDTDTPESREEWDMFWTKLEMR